MLIDWTSLAQVIVVSFGAGVGLILLFSLGVAALATGERTGPDGAVHRAALHVLAAGLCFLACALVVVYGLYMIVTAT
ncbi:hypothetical protein [Pseudonocardia acidicola]|uniref:Secreted protein n=1 Tax=Pseudonocardia acidicola TaxID=2724939 RepID=A0ABX1SK11_9PSEU|nr:hypothetical protein [Pseudonocardia acidicola]NMI01905.1 hypothetical protein [Pseudonocardia acidicola]